MKNTVFPMMIALLLLARVAAAEGISLPAATTDIGEEAFFGNTAITEVELPDGITRVGDRAFAESGLKRIVLPDSLEEIGKNVFPAGTVAYTSNRVSLWKNREFSVVSYRVTDESTVLITGYFGSDEIIEIPDVIAGCPVTEIGDGAFSGSRKLREIILPASLKRIGAEAFIGCTLLDCPVFPLGLREIGDRAFKGTNIQTLILPRSVTHIGADAFTGLSRICYWSDTYSETWALEINQINHLALEKNYIGSADASVRVAMPGEQVTCTARLREAAITSFQWQKSDDGVTWTGCEGADGLEYTFTASPENCNCEYRLAGTDFTGTYYTTGISVVCLHDGISITDAYVSGTQISLSWDAVWEGVVYTVYMTGSDGLETAVAEDISETFCDVLDLEPETAYSFRLKTRCGALSVISDPLTVTTQNYRTGTVYRALLIGQVHFSDALTDCPDSIGDLNLLFNMLRHVTGPEGNPYTFVRKVDLTAEEIHQAIQSTFAGADEDDVSLFFIATHGFNSAYGKSTYGALAAYNPATGEDEFIEDTTLAEWLSEVPGQFVVLLEACSSGSAIQDPAGLTTVTDDAVLTAMNDAAVSAFSSADRALELQDERLRFNQDGEAAASPPMLRLGGLRQTKFHVLTSSAHMHDSYAYMENDFPHTLFTYALTEGVGLTGAMPCDTNGDGLASLNELVSYINGFSDPYMSYIYQKAQAYPAGSDYPLFFREP